MVKVFAGTLKGKRLATCRVRSLRPTSEKIREAIFNIITPLLTEGAVLDLFAGTGSLGIEALSRGMERAVFIESNVHIFSVLKKNIITCHLDDKTEIMRLPVTNGLKILRSREETFKIIFLDPPYQEKMAARTIGEISAANILTHDGFVIAEHSTRERLEPLYGNLKMDDQRKYGQTLVSFFTYLK